MPHRTTMSSGQGKGQVRAVSISVQGQRVASWSCPRHSRFSTRCWRTWTASASADDVAASPIFDGFPMTRHDRSHRTLRDNCITSLSERVVNGSVTLSRKMKCRLIVTHVFVSGGIPACSFFVSCQVHTLLLIPIISEVYVGSDV